MDARQETRERFDSWMVWPDRIFIGVGFVSVGMGVLLVMEGISPTKAANARQDFMLFFAVTSACVAALAALYFVFRFAAATLIAALAIRRQRRVSSRRASDHPADRPDAPVQIARSL